MCIIGLSAEYDLMLHSILNYRQSKMFWSDVTTDSIHRASMTGEEEEVLVETNLIAVGKTFLSLYCTAIDLNIFTGVIMRKFE